MPFFALNNELVFPPPHLAEEDGLLAVGGDLRPERILLAYQNGIFPWYSEGEPILWWSPDPRFVIYPENFRFSKSLRPILRKKQFQITYDTDFLAVMRECQKAYRPGQSGTWITEDMIEAYVELHDLGYAHSVEVRLDGELVGGVYGMALGSCFAGESMFAKVSNASKVGFVTLAQDLFQRNYQLIDCQIYTEHLARFGAEEIPRHKFVSELHFALQHKQPIQKWTDWR